MNHAKAIGQRNGRWAGDVGMAVGAAFAAALIGLTNAPVAGAEGGAVDTAVDNFLQGIANLFPPEVEGEALGDPDTFCGTLLSCSPEPPGEQMIDSLYQTVNTAFQPEGPIDNFFDQLLGTAPAADPAQALDIQASIFGIDLFPTAGNTATADSGPTDIAIAIGNGANAQAIGGFFDSAFADGANSVASTGSFSPVLTVPLWPDNFDIAFVLGTGSEAAISGGGVFVPTTANFDVAAVFGDMLTALVTNTSGVVDIAP